MLNRLEYSGSPCRKRRKLVFGQVRPTSESHPWKDHFSLSESALVFIMLCQFCTFHATRSDPEKSARQDNPTKPAAERLLKHHNCPERCWEEIYQSEVWAAVDQENKVLLLLYWSGVTLPEDSCLGEAAVQMVGLCSLEKNYSVVLLSRVFAKNVFAKQQLSLNCHSKRVPLFRMHSIGPTSVPSPCNRSPYGTRVLGCSSLRLPLGVVSLCRFRSQKNKKIVFLAQRILIAQKVVFWSLDCRNTQASIALRFMWVGPQNTSENERVKWPLPSHIWIPNHKRIKDAD